MITENNLQVYLSIVPFGHTAADTFKINIFDPSAIDTPVEVGSYGSDKLKPYNRVQRLNIEKTLPVEFTFSTYVKYNAGYKPQDTFLWESLFKQVTPISTQPYNVDLSTLVSAIAEREVHLTIGTPEGEKIHLSRAVVVGADVEFDLDKPVFIKWTIKALFADLVDNFPAQFTDYTQDSNFVYGKLTTILVTHNSVSYPVKFVSAKVMYKSGIAEQNRKLIGYLAGTTSVKTTNLDVAVEFDTNATTTTETLADACEANPKSKANILFSSGLFSLNFQNVVLAPENYDVKEIWKLNFKGAVSGISETPTMGATSTLIETLPIFCAPYDVEYSPTLPVYTELTWAQVAQSLGARAVWDFDNHTMSGATGSGGCLEVGGNKKNCYNDWDGGGYVSGAYVYDKTGNGHTLVISGCCFLSRCYAGTGCSQEYNPDPPYEYVGCAPNFKSGTSLYMYYGWGTSASDVRASCSFNPAPMANEFSITGWVKANPSSGSINTFIAKCRHYDRYAFSLSVENGSIDVNAILGIRLTNNVNYQFRADNCWGGKKWRKWGKTVTATWRPLNGNASDVQIYVNGVPQAVTGPSYPLLPLRISGSDTNGIQINGDGWSGSYGVLHDNIALFDTALSASEVQDLVNALD